MEQAMKEKIHPDQPAQPGKNEFKPMKKYGEIFYTDCMSAGDAVIMIDEENRVSFWNPAAKALFGYAADEINGRHCSLFMQTDTPIDETCFHRERFHGEVQKNSEGKLLEITAIKKDGSRFPAELTLSEITACGKTHFIAIVRSIEARKAVEKELSKKKIHLEKIIRELSENRERLDLALRASESGLWDWNIQTGEVVFNEGWASMLGYRLAEVENHVRSWEKLLHPDEKEAIFESLENHLSGKTPIYQTEHRLLCKNKEWKWILDTGKVVERDNQGNPVRAIGTHIDIHEKKMIEKKLMKYQQELEQEVTLRTKELEKTQKALVNKAMEAGRAQLSAMILHNIGNAVTPIGVCVENFRKNDIREPLGYLLKCYQDLLDHKASIADYIMNDQRGIAVLDLMGDLIKNLETRQIDIKETADRVFSGINYISEILTLQRSYAPGRVGLRQNVNLAVLAKDALKLQEGMIKKRRIVIETILPENIPRILIEKNRLMQVVVNLIKNSCDAIEENRARTNHKLRVTVFENNNRIGITISDTGIGIKSQRFNEIFDFGVSSKGSSGFGLYYCRNFVQENNGTLTVTSSGPGQGAAFTMEFQLA